MEPFLVLLVIFGSTGLILWKYLENNHKVKMTILEKGMTAEEFQKIFKTRFKEKDYLRSLQFGLVSLFIGCGILVGLLIRALVISNIYQQIQPYLTGQIEDKHNMAWQINQSYLVMADWGIFASIVIFGGIGMMLFYFIASKKIIKEQKS